MFLNLFPLACLMQYAQFDSVNKMVMRIMWEYHYCIEVHCHVELERNDRRKPSFLTLFSSIFLTKNKSILGAHFCSVDVFFNRHNSGNQHQLKHSNSLKQKCVYISTILLSRMSNTCSNRGRLKILVNYCWACCPWRIKIAFHHFQTAQQCRVT